MLQFERQDFELVRDHLAKAFATLPKFKDSFLNLGFRLLKIKVDIESEEWEQANHNLRALGMYLHNNQVLSPRLAEAVRTRVHYLKRVFNLLANQSGDGHKLRTKIQDEQPFREKKWLLAKLDAYLAG